MFMFNECLIHLCDCTCLDLLHLLNHMLIKHKKIFEFFNCFWKVFLLWKFSKTVQLCFGDSTSRVKQVASLLRSFRDSLASQAPSHKKDLENYQKSGFFRIFATQFGEWFMSGSFSREVYSEWFTTYSRVDLPVVKNT